MNAAVVLVAVTFAAYRLTRLIVVDTILDRPREALFRRWSPDAHWFGALISCPFCAGWWCSGLMLGLAHLVGLAHWRLVWDLVLWWAVAGGQCILSAVDERLNH